MSFLVNCNLCVLYIQKCLIDNPLILECEINVDQNLNLERSGVKVICDVGIEGTVIIIFCCSVC